jgi:hypothetical protein
MKIDINKMMLDVKVKPELKLKPKAEPEPELFFDKAFNFRVSEYAQKNNLKVIRNLKDAIIERRKGTLCFSPREVDIMARGNMTLESEAMSLVLLEDFDYFLCEGIPEQEENVFSNRLRYNRGLLWFSANQDKKGSQLYDKCITVKEKLIQYFIDKSLPAWPEEIEGGFNEEFLHPEWMTSDEYYKLRRTKSCKVVD